jgi:hypothetical protein
MIISYLPLNYLSVSQYKKNHPHVDLVVQSPKKYLKKPYFKRSLDLFAGLAILREPNISLFVSKGFQNTISYNVGDVRLGSKGAYYSLHFIKENKSSCNRLRLNTKYNLIADFYADNNYLHITGNSPELGFARAVSLSNNPDMPNCYSCKYFNDLLPTLRCAVHPFKRGLDTIGCEDFSFDIPT